MAYAQPQAWYIHSGDGLSSGYYGVPAYSNKTWTAGQLCRPLTGTGLSIGNERVYICTAATPTLSTAEPTWTFTKGAVQTATPSTVTFQECSGEPALNGDLTNCPIWNASSNPPIGRIIYVSSNGTLQICSVSSGVSLASVPAFSATPGVVTNDSANRWVCLGAASAFGPWSAPAARVSLANITNAGTSGNDFYVADNSQELTSLAVVLNMGSSAVPSRIMSIDNTVTTRPPPASALKFGASITCTGNLSNAIIVGSGASQGSYWSGVTFASSGNGSPGIVLGLVASNYHRFDNCWFQLAPGSAGAGVIALGATTSGAASVELNGCVFQFSNAGQSIQLGGGGPHIWRNTPNPSIFSTPVPTILFKSVVASPANLLIEGVDLSALGANTLFSNIVPSDLVTVKNCTLHSGAIVGTFSSAGVSTTIDVVNSDIPGGNTYRNERYNYWGLQTTSNAVYRSGGASDGVTPISHFIQSNANARTWKPYAAIPLVIWNDIVGTPRTVTIYGAVNGSAVLPTNDKFWFDATYIGQPGGGTVLGMLLSTGLATTLTTPSTITVADATSIWTGLGGTNAPFKLAATFTATQKGYVTIYPKAVSYSVYLDPQPVLT